jgi:O-antigen/teichoic acid export membrane protein
MAGAFNIVVRETAILSFPICCGFASITPTLFAVFLDNRWQPGIVPAQIMAFTVVPLTFYYCCTAVLLAAREPHLDSRSAVILTASSVLTVLVAAPFGIKIVCCALVLQSAAFLPVPLTMVRRACASSPFAVVWKQLPLLAAAAIMGLGVAVVAPFIDLRIGHLATLPVLIVVGVAIYVPLAALAAPSDTKRLIHRVTSMVRWTINQVT